MNTELKLIEPSQDITLELLEAKQHNELIEYFQPNGLQPLIDSIALKAKGLPTDFTIKENQAIIRSSAAEIASQKVKLEKIGKLAIDELSKTVKSVTAERIRAVDAIQQIQNDVRKPLTDWENADKARIAKIKDNIKKFFTDGHFIQANWRTLSIDAMENCLTNIESDLSNYDEFSAEATETKNTAIQQINDAISLRRKHDAEQAELAELRRLKEENERKERERQIAENARLEAEQKAEAELQAEKDRAAQEILLAENKRQQLEATAKRLEREAIEEKHRVEQAVILAAQKAEEDKAKAIEQERIRIEQEQKKIAEETAKREADIKHKEKINNIILGDFIAEGIAENIAKEIIRVISQGKITGLKINY